MIAAVPEPASIYLFLAALAVSLWAIYRYMRDERRPADKPAED
jgi:hypothetical protein